MKMIFVAGLLSLITSQVFAAVREGNFNYQQRSYYSNGVGAYCQRHQYHYEYSELNYWDVNELRYTQFDGMCDEGYAQSGMNYQGRSYYANAQGHYCSFPYFRPELRQIDYYEAQVLFQKIYDGVCRQ